MTNKDCISREAVLEGKVIHQFCDGVEIINGYAVPVNYIEQLPSIQPTAKENLVVEDCISREEIRKLICQNNDAYGYSDRFHEFTEKCLQLPSITPKYTDEEIQKMQELEQVQLEKAYELGKIESFEEWLSSFNTESATTCYTAVQELKKKLEVKR